MRRPGQVEVDCGSFTVADLACCSHAAAIAELRPVIGETDQIVRPNDRFICMAVSDLPVPHVPSFRDTCDVCGSGVWRSNRSAGLCAVPEGLRCAGESIRARQARGEAPMVQAATYPDGDPASHEET
jgi:hypothetical protein